MSLRDLIGAVIALQVLLIAGLYGMAAFVAADWNIRAWEQEGRAFVAMVWLLMTYAKGAYIFANWSSIRAMEAEGR